MRTWPEVWAAEGSSDCTSEGNRDPTPVEGGGVPPAHQEKDIRKAHGAQVRGLRHASVVGPWPKSRPGPRAPAARDYTAAAFCDDSVIQMSTAELSADAPAEGQGDCTAEAIRDRSGQCLRPADSPGGIPPWAAVPFLVCGLAINEGGPS